MKTIDYRDILHPGYLTIKQTEVALVFALAALLQHRLVGQVFMHLAQIAAVQPHKRVEPQQAADHLHRQPVPAVALRGVQPFVAQHLLQFGIGHATTPCHNIAEKGERRLLPVGHRHAETSLTYKHIFLQFMPKHAIAHHKNQYTQRHSSPIQYTQHRPHIHTAHRISTDFGNRLLYRCVRCFRHYSRQLKQISATTCNRRPWHNYLRMHQRQYQTQCQCQQQKETVHIQAMLPPQQQAIDTPEQSRADHGKKQIACHFSTSLIKVSRSSIDTSFLSTKNDTMLRNEDPK